MEYNKELPVGKLDTQILEEIVLKPISKSHAGLITPPGLGLDCGILDFDDNQCIVTSDPISATVQSIGSLAIDINCNDIATTGTSPMAISLVLMLPVGTTAKDIDIIMTDARRRADDLGVMIVAGHTEITEAVKQPLVVATAIGKKAKKDALDIKPKNGDLILMTKQAGIEGTGIIFSELEEPLSKYFSTDEIASGKKLLEQTSVVREGVIAGKYPVSMMHDITEGGVLGAIWEMCKASELGCEVYEDKIPVLNLTRQLAKTLDIEYMRLISSGSMIIFIDEGSKNSLIEGLSDSGIDCCVIGHLTDNSPLLIDKNGVSTEILPPGADELYKALKWRG